MHTQRPRNALQLWSTLVLTIVLAGARPTAAVEVRTTDGALLYEAGLRRAYAPCVAPNAVTDLGHPACMPPATSSCTFYSAHVTIDRGTTVVLDVVRNPGDQSELCRDGNYHLRTTLRRTAFDADTRCASQTCTMPDVTDDSLPFTLSGFSSQVHSSLGLQPQFANVEVLGVSVIAPDGLPMAATALGGVQEEGRMNLSIGYELCTSPAPGYEACDMQPWASPCDFSFGEVTLRDLTAATFATTLHGLSGTSPVCTSGVYQVESRVRLTMETCGPNGDLPCTLTDTTLVAPLAASGSELSASAALNGATARGALLTAEVLGFRVFDPTGALFATSAVVRAEELTRVVATFKKGTLLRVGALFPADEQFNVIDPANDDGATFTLHDRNGVIYTVTIPAAMWQLQPPLGERWEYKDRAGSRAGVKKILIRMVKKRGVPIGYDVRLAADAIDLSSADLGAVTATFSIARREPVLIPGPKVAQSTRYCTVKSTKKQCE